MQNHSQWASVCKEAKLDALFRLQSSVRHRLGHCAYVNLRSSLAEKQRGRTSLLDWAYEASSTLLVQGRSYWLAVLGTLLTIAGFGLTFFQLKKTRDATEAVNKEIKRIKFSVIRYEASIETVRAEQALKAVESHMRRGEWLQAGKQVSAITKSIHILIELKIPEFFPHTTKLEAVRLHTSRLSERIDEAIPAGLTIAEKNKALSTLRDHERVIDSVRISLDRSNIGE